jgi:1-pyrroline-5-carboxylate dehydrogenase
MCAGALMMANTVVFKPTSAAPFSGLKLYQIYREAGVPAGAVNFITGSGKTFGEVVSASKGIDGVAFVGSMEVGTSLQRQFAERQPYTKPFISEMGSKNPAIVSDEANLDKAAAGVLKGAFGYQGQKCSATSRVYVQKKVAQSFTEMLVAKTKELKVGNPITKDVFMGPVVDDKAVQTYERWVEKAKADGGKVLCGGRVLREGALSHGFYVEPTVIAGLAPDHSIFKEELFLPVLAVAEYDRLEDGLKMANDTDYGLTAGIFTEDKAEIEQFFRNIQFGVCYANRSGGATTGAWPGAQSFVGWKASGTTGKGVLGPHYLQGFAREQAHTVVE